MPRINIYEHSETYSFQVANKAYACVAFPITAIWGPAYDPADEDVNPDWIRFPAGYRGTTDFVNTFRGANTTSGAREKSYDYALKLLASGYDVLVKRADGLGQKADGAIQFSHGSGVRATGSVSLSAGGPAMSNCTQSFTAKPYGMAGNRLKVNITRTSPSITSTQYLEGTGRVDAVLKVFLAPEGQSDEDAVTINAADVLLETRRVSYMQVAADATLNPPTPVSQVVDFGSDYIAEASITNLGYLPQPGEIGSLPPGYREFTVSLGRTITGDTPQTGTPGSGDATMGILSVQAKYPGSYGNQLKLRLKVSVDTYNRPIGTIEVFDRNKYTRDNNRIVRTDQLLEVAGVALSMDAASDARPYITDVSLSNIGTVTIQNASSLASGEYVVSLVGGTDNAIIGSGIDTTTVAIDTQIRAMLAERFDVSGSSFQVYINDLIGDSTASPVVAPKVTTDRIEQIWNQQRVFCNAIAMISELTDPLVYDWDAVFYGIADDQYIPLSWQEENPEVFVEYEPTVAHLRLFEVAANSKCGAALVGTPYGMKRGTENTQTGLTTHAVKFMNNLASYVGPTLSTFGELVGPWCKGTLPINGANAWVAPEVAHLLLIINAQGVGGQNKWWMVPAGMLGTGVVHSPEYKIKKAYLDIIQNHDEGVCFNPLMQVPGKGFTCFGNSTLWDKPLGSYNALQNLSTRFLCNRVKQRIWDTALQILFKYNNQNAYSHFYAGVSPLLDEMRAVGALTSTEANPWGYRIIMNPDIINLDRINANTVIGKVELAITGVIDTVDVDLFLLPPTAFQENA